MKLLKKILKCILICLAIFLAIVFYNELIKPMYLKYQDKKSAYVVDTSGELATRKDPNKTLLSRLKNAIFGEDDKNSSSNNDNENRVSNNDNGPQDKDTSSLVGEYNAFIVDDRILLYEGEVKGNFVKSLLGVLIEDIDIDTYSKVDVGFKNVNGLSASEISYSNLDLYKNVLNQAINNIDLNGEYVVSYEYTNTKTNIEKVIIEMK